VGEVMQITIIFYFSEVAESTCTPTLRGACIYRSSLQRCYLSGSFVRHCAPAPRCAMYRLRLNDRIQRWISLLKASLPMTRGT
jgi:hypothetical protein